MFTLAPSPAFNLVTRINISIIINGGDPLILRPNHFIDVVLDLFVTQHKECKKKGEK